MWCDVVLFTTVSRMKTGNSGFTLRAHQESPACSSSLDQLIELFKTVIVCIYAQQTIPQCTRVHLCANLEIPQFRHARPHTHTKRHLCTYLCKITGCNAYSSSPYNCEILRMYMPCSLTHTCSHKCHRMSTLIIFVPGCVWACAQMPAYTYRTCAYRCADRDTHTQDHLAVHGPVLYYF